MKFIECEKDFDNLNELQQFSLMSQITAFKILNSYDIKNMPPPPRGREGLPRLAVTADGKQ